MYFCLTNVLKVCLNNVDCLDWKLIVLSNLFISKAGRPPTRKLSDRKAYTRQKHTAMNASVDFLGSLYFKFLKEKLANFWFSAD